MLLGDYCRKIGSGATPRGGTSVYRAVGTAFIRSQNVYNDRFDKEGLVYIGPEHADDLAGVAVEAGDILLNITGDSVARVNRPPADILPARVSQHVAIIRPRSDSFDSRFLYYYLAGPYQQAFMLSLASAGGTRNALTKGMIERFLVPKPPLSEQVAIAFTLGALDDKIELNRKMNRTLEATAQTTFKSWFVDFDPVVAKAAGRKPFGMDAATAALFPDRFAESKIGPIPDGWRVGSVADLARYVNGRNFTKGASGSGRMVVRIAELNSGPGGSTVYSHALADAENIVEPGDLLFSWSGSLDVYRWHRPQALINQHIFKVISSGYPQWFVHFQLSQAMPFFQQIAAGKATTMGHIKREHLSQALLALPPRKLLETADRNLAAVYSLTHQNELESATLAEVRDLLLPKLLSGEIRVKDAEKLVGAANP